MKNPSRLLLLGSSFFLCHSTANAQKIYWLSWNSIQRADLDGSSRQTIVQPSESVFFPSIALDLTHGKVYWRINTPDCVTDWIRRADLDGSIVEDVIQTSDSGCSVTGGVAVDPNTAMAYWGEFVGISRTSFDGTGVELLAGPGVRYLPVGIAIDKTNGKIYWASNDYDIAVGALQRANLDGTEVEDLLWPTGRLRGVALDLTRGKIYWTDSDQHRIQRANLDGTNVEDFLSNLPDPWGIAVDPRDGSVYWSDGTVDRIKRASADGLEVQDVLIENFVFAPLAIDPGRVYGDVEPSGGNFVVDVDDLLHVLNGFSDPVQFPAADVFPCNGNTLIDVDDILAELEAFSGNPACRWSDGMWVPN